MCVDIWLIVLSVAVFFFNDTATTKSYTYAHPRSLHNALPIFHALALAALKARIAEASDRQVMPLRVAGRIPGFERERGLKFRHLIFGDPRRPGALDRKSTRLNSSH